MAINENYSQEDFDLYYNSCLNDINDDDVVFDYREGLLNLDDYINEIYNGILVEEGNEELARDVSESIRAYISDDFYGDIDNDVPVEEQIVEDFEKTDAEDIFEAVNGIVSSVDDITINYSENDETEYLDIKVEWGDWKHDHLYLDNIIEGLPDGWCKIDETVTDSDGSDTYSSIHRYARLVEDEYNEGLEILPDKNPEGTPIGTANLGEALLPNGALDTKTFDKALHNDKLESDLSNREFSDNLFGIIYRELDRMKSPETERFGDGYYEYAQVYELLDDEGKKAATDFVVAHLFVPGSEGSEGREKAFVEEWWGQLDDIDDDKKVLRDCGISMHKLKDKGWETLWRFDGTVASFEKAIDAGYFYSLFEAPEQIINLSDNLKQKYLVKESLNEGILNESRWCVPIEKCVGGGDRTTEVDRVYFNSREEADRFMRAHRFKDMDTPFATEVISVGGGMSDADFWNADRRYWNTWEGGPRNFDESLTEAAVPPEEYLGWLDQYSSKSRKPYDLGLPTDVDVPISELRIDVDDLDDSWGVEDAINNYLSDEYGYLVNNYSYNIEGDTIKVRNISWDIDESLTEASKLDVISSNKKAYQRLEKEIENTPDGLTKDIMKELGLRWCKGNNWAGGLPDRVFSKYAQKIVDKYGVSFDNVYEKFLKFINNFTESLTEAVIDDKYITRDGDGYEVEVDNKHFFSWDIPIDKLIKILKKQCGKDGVIVKQPKDDKPGEIRAITGGPDPVTSIFKFDNKTGLLSQGSPAGEFTRQTNELLTEDKNETLNPALWEGDELKPEVKEKLKFIADTFIKKLEEDDIPLDVDDIIIVGSNANYNFGPSSDIDLHIVADLSQFKGREKELAEKIYQCKKAIFNDKYDPMINGFEVEIYVEPAEDKNNNEIPDEVEKGEEVVEESLITEAAANSNGVYSIMQNKWLKVPVRDDIPDNVELEPELSEWKERASKCSTIDEINSFIDDIYKLRQGSILEEGEYGKGNLIFKEIRNAGTLQELKDKKIELENDEMSLSEAYDYKTYEDLCNHYYDPYLSQDDLERIWDEIMEKYDDVDLANDVVEELEHGEDEMWQESLNREKAETGLEAEPIEESAEDFVARRDADVIEDYRKRANLEEGAEITEENLDDWALTGTSCYMNYDYNDLKNLLVGGNK